jgi:Glu-tRNA(Gln) amidotransferase subunit E-like FAD-binding protein
MNEEILDYLANEELDKTCANKADYIVEKSLEDLALDITNIVKKQVQQLEKENERLKENWCQETTWREILKDENIILKKSNEELVELCAKLQSDLKEANEKLDNIKYLNEKEVEKIIERIYPLYPPANTQNITYKEAITAICELGIDKSIGGTDV